jgi:hypothetical protein
MNTSGENEDMSETKAIGQKTPIQLGFVIAIVITCLSCVGGACTLAWWASTLTADMAWVKTSLATIVTRFNDLDGLKSRVQMIETYGSPKLGELDKRVEKIEKDLELHKAITVPPK